METATENDVVTEEEVITENREEEEQEQEQEEQRTELFMDFSNLTRKRKKRSFHVRFVNGLAVGFGIGCIATFIILWAAVFFTPKLPQTITYEGLLSVFIYPLLYLLTIGLISLTAGLVKERFQPSPETQ